MAAYNRILSSIVALLLAVCAAVIIWVQPVYGDLTRIGAWPERWFGWRDPQQKIPSFALHDAGVGSKKILVLGDSFSDAGFWQAYLGDRYSFSFVHISTTDLSMLPALVQRERADAVVIETVERTFVDVFGEQGTFVHAKADCGVGAVSSTTMLSADSLQAGMAALPQFPLTTRLTIPESLARLAEGFHYLKLWAKLALKPRRKAIALALDSDRLFSSLRSDSLLVLSGDVLLKQRVGKQDAEVVRCGMQSVARRLQVMSVPFVLLAVPDKTTTYQPYLADKALRNAPSLIGRVQPESVAHTINMLPFLQVALQQEQRDLYLPDDTHWGYAGFRQAAVLIDYELASQWK